MLRIEVEGGGTIDNATSWTSTARLSAAGSFSFSMPATDPAAALAAPMATVFCYVDTVQVGAGVIDDLSITDGVLTASGDDLTRELALAALSFTIEYSPADLITYLGTKLPAGWTLVNTVSAIAITINLTVLRDSFLNTLVTVCERAGLHFAVQGRTLTVSDSWGALVEGALPTRVRKSVSSYDVVNKVYPYGSGDGYTALTLLAATATLPAGYSVDTTNNAITHTASPYALRARRLDFPDIAPVANTDSAVINAANALLLAGYTALRKAQTPVVSYAVSLLWNGLLWPRQQLRLTYASDALRVDETLVITESAVRAEAGGVVTTDLLLEAGGRRILGDAEVVTKAIRLQRKGAVQPQLAPTQDTISMVADVDAWNREPALWMQFSSILTQVQSVWLTVAMRPRKVQGGIGIEPPLPSSLNYRVNNGGAWSAVPAAGVDITSLLINPTTRRPIQMENVINLQCGLRTELLDIAAGQSLTSMPSPAWGTKFVVARVAGAPQRIVMCATSNMSPSNVIKELKEGTWLEISHIGGGDAVQGLLANFNLSSTYSGLYGLVATDGQAIGYVPMWMFRFVNPNFQIAADQSLFFPGGYPYQTAGFSATLLVQLTMKLSMLANV